jgi:hypothetical protein
LAEVQARVDQRCLDERLTDVSAFLVAGDTEAAAQRVNSTLAELAGGKAGRVKVNLAELGKSGALASDVLGLHSELAALARVEAALQAAGARRRIQLLGVDTTNVPKTVKEALKDLRALESLRAALARPGEAPLPAVAQVEAALVPAARIAGGDPSVARLRQDVSARLFLEGRASEARQVLGDGTQSREHAAALLRDLRRVVMGEGTVSTRAVADVVAPEGPGNGGATPPAVVRDLAPEGKPGDWKPPVRESPLADLGPVADAERLVGRLEGRVGTEVRTARKNGDEQTRLLAEQIRTHLRTVHPIHLAATDFPVHLGALSQGDDDERDFLAQVIEELGRPLTALERDRVRAWHRAGKSRQEIVKDLREAAQP